MFKKTILPYCHLPRASHAANAAILIIKIGCFKARRWRALKQPIFIMRIAAANGKKW